MKTISKREGKNYEIEVKGDLHQYPDGSVHTVKNGKDVWEGGGSGGVVYAEFSRLGIDTWTCDKTYAELKAAYDSGKLLIGVYGADKNLMSYRVIGQQSAFLVSIMSVDMALEDETSLTSLTLRGFGILNDETVIEQTSIGHFADT